MSDPSLPAPSRRLYSVLITWFEEQRRTGALKPGDRLPPERKLVEQFGMSRTAVREALQSLAARGLIESFVGRGTFVRVPTLEHLRCKMELLPPDAQPHADETFAHLMASLAALAAQRGTPDAIAHLRAALAGSDEAFATALGRAAQNPFMAILAQAMTRSCAGRAARIDRARVVAAVAAGDAEEARDAVLSRCPVGA